MKRTTLFVTVLGLSLSSYAETNVDSIELCTPEWQHYTEKNGEGLYHELWRAIYKESGIEINVTYAPYKRCKIGVLEQQKYDAWPGGYASEVTDAIIKPEWEIGSELISVAYKKGTIGEWTGQELLTGKAVGWERGYGFNKNGVIDVEVKPNTFTDLKASLKMVNGGRIDFLADYQQALNTTIKEMGLEDDIEVAHNVIKGPKYYMLFRNTDKGRSLAQIWDERMKAMEQSGELSKLYNQYGDKAY